MIRYEKPRSWLAYRPELILTELIEAKSALQSLLTIPYQRSWAEKLQQIQLKREVAGTSRIEGAEFTEHELEQALREDISKLETRSQKQAAASVRAYRWIAALANDMPITKDLILRIHHLIVEGADDDHCPPGKLRGQDENVTFGAPRHRGVEGGRECSQVFGDYCEAFVREFRAHDPLIQALAAHYHLAAMHPFLDGNGRTARAMEALFLQRVGLKDTLFIAMSNYYYEEKVAYLEALAAVRQADHDITPFLKFGLKGIALQCRRLFEQIRVHVSKALFRNQMYELFNRLETPRKRVLAERQLGVLKLMLDHDEFTLDELLAKTRSSYQALGNVRKAQIRDLNGLIQIGALKHAPLPQGGFRLSLNLNWPTEITESIFYLTVQGMPKAKTHSFLA